MSSQLTPRKKPALSGLLSFLVPGLGQLYNGHIWRGLFWLVITPGLWLGTGGFLGWACHFASAYTAYRRAEDMARGLPVPQIPSRLGE